MGYKARIALLGTLPFLFLLILWQTFHQYAIFPRWLIPSPWETAVHIGTLMSDGTLLHLLGRSAYNEFPAFFIAFVFSVCAGVAIGLSKTVDAIFRPFLSALYTVPSLAWLPLVILFFGFSHMAIWAVIFISSTTKMIYNIVDGVRGVHVAWLLLGQNMGISYLSRVWHIVFPASLPFIITGSRLGFAASWRSLIGAEMLVMTFGGIGRFMWMGQWNFEYENVIAGIIVVGMVGILVEQLFLLLERRTLVRWGWL